MLTGRPKFGVFSGYPLDQMTDYCTPRRMLFAKAHRNWSLLPFAAIAIITALSGCTLGDDKALTMVNRGKYALYDCFALGTQARESALRERELRTAMEKASRGPGGEAVIATMYRPEYLTVKGELEELELMANKKNCRNALKSQSDAVIQ